VGESCANCPADCPCSPGASCTPAGQCAPCGDGLCEGGETECTCAVDCPDSCGDGCCTGSEGCLTCDLDCPCPPPATCNPMSGVCN
jgi:hypothetical protein